MPSDSSNDPPSPTMPQGDGRRKRSWLILPYVLAVIAAVAWSAWWVYGRGQIAQALDRLKPGEVSIAWKTRSITGFPFRYDIVLTDLAVGAPDQSSLTAPRLELEAAAYASTHWVGVFQGPVHINAAGHDFTVDGDRLAFSISHPDQNPPRISIEGIKLRLTGQTPFAAIDRFELHLAAKAQNQASFFLRIDHATAQPDSVLARIAPGNGVIVGLEGDILNAPSLRGAGPVPALQAWAQGGGAFNIRQGGVQAGQALLSLGPSAIAPRPDGRIEGELALSLSRAQDAVLALGAVGGLPPETAAVASGVASAGSFLTPPGKALNVRLKFQNGVAFVEGVPLGPAPRLF